MTNKEIYRIWAPLNKLWVDWVRPVPFVAMENAQIEQFHPDDFILPPALDKFSKHNNLAIIIDLQGSDSIEQGVLLAKRGYRPIPIFNGTQAPHGARATTDNSSMLGALIWGASILSTIAIDDDARPVFLTDSNRLHTRRIDGSIYDNSWDVYPQDLPSEDYLIKQGITEILVVGNFLARDLKAIFADYPKKQLSIYVTDGYDKPKRIRKGKKAK